jgi:hypothetical protein
MVLNLNPGIRAIVDKTVGKLYLCFNKALERSFHGPPFRKVSCFRRM